MRFETPSFDEGFYQRQLVRQIESDHYELHCSNAEIAGRLPETIWHLEQPVVRLAPYHLLSSDTALVKPQGLRFEGYQAPRPESILRTQAQGVLNLQARVIELDRKYCDVIVRRWEAITGARHDGRGERRNGYSTITPSADRKRRVLKQRRLLARVLPFTLGAPERSLKVIVWRAAGSKVASWVQSPRKTMGRNRP